MQQTSECNKKDADSKNKLLVTTWGGGQRGGENGRHKCKAQREYSQYFVTIADESTFIIV